RPGTRHELIEITLFGLRLITTGLVTRFICPRAATSCDCASRSTTAPLLAIIDLRRLSSLPRVPAHPERAFETPDGRAAAPAPDLVPAARRPRRPPPCARSTTRPSRGRRSARTLPLRW